MSAVRAFRSSRKIGLTLLLFLGLNALLSLIVVGFRIAERGLFRRIARGDVVSVAEATRSDDRIAVVNGISIGLLVVTGVVWLVWQHRAQVNLLAARVPALRFTPGWVVGWWFVPIASLWKPFQTMRELWKASGGRPDWDHEPTWPVIGWWWAAWIAAGIVDRAAAAQYRNARAIEPILVGNLWLMITEVVSIAAALLAVALVRSVIERQAALELPAPADATPPRPDLPALGS